MIYGKHIRLRAIEKEFLPLFVAWLNDPEVRANIAAILPFSLDEENNWYENMLKNPQAERPLTIEVSQDGGWVPIGNCGLHAIDSRNRSSEFGIFIGDKTYWNRGYGSEAVQLMVRHGFTTLNLHRIYLRTFETNLRAIHVYEKAGFIHEGRFRQAEYRNGKYIDVLFMSILKPEWEQRMAQEQPK